MKQKFSWSGIGACVGMLLLILDGKTALAGARIGVELCIRTVIPALFPFIVLSSFVMGTPFSILGPLARLCRIPKGAESVLVPAFLGGYPVGAQSVAAAYRAGQLEKDSAQRMLAFCNNAGPSFLFGMAASLFPKIQTIWALWSIHLGSAILTARLFPSDLGRPASVVPRQNRDVLASSIRVMGLICGWVVLFRVVIAFLERWFFFLLSAQAQVLVTGLLELTNGCCALPKVASPQLRFVLCSGMLALGGLCVTMQTVSVTRGLSLKYYFMGKGLQCLFSLMLCGCLMGEKYCLVFTPLLYFLLIRIQKRGRIPAPAIV